MKTSDINRNRLGNEKKGNRAWRREMVARVRNQPQYDRQMNARIERMQLSDRKRGIIEMNHNAAHERAVKRRMEAKKALA